MNTNLNDENRRRRSAYADFDEHGNPLTGNIESLSRYTPQSRFGSFGRNVEAPHSQQEGQYNSPAGRVTNATRATGNFSEGTPYGEGGSYEGGGTGYGRSRYGTSRREGPGFSHQEGYGPESRRYSDNDYDNFINRNYGYFGRSSDAGYINEGPNRSSEQPSNVQNRRYGDSFGDTGREGRGYDRGYGGFGNTGYGATGYNMRDEDRERSSFINRGQNLPNRSISEADERRYGRRNPYRRETDW